MAAVESLLLHKPFCTGNCTRADPEGHCGLTPREQLVVKLVAEGNSNKGISCMLNLSVKTTEAHRAAAMRKLGVNSTAGLVRYAVRVRLTEI
jgi:DNA-binding NarL/FixJ family response regulator